MGEILKSEVIVVAMEREEGVTFEEFSGLFHQVHGYQLRLTNYGYKSLKDLLDDMKDVIELQNVNGQQLIKYRPPCQRNVIPPCMDISSQENDPYMSDTCSASSSNCWSQTGDIPLDEFPREHSSCQQNAAGISGHKPSHPAIQSTSQSLDYLASEDYFTMDTCCTIPQMLLKKIVEIISQKMRRHPTGLKATKLKQYMLEKHRIDLETYSQSLGYTDMLSMLKEIPAIKFQNTSGKNIIIASCFYKNQFEHQHKASAKVQLSNASTSSSAPSAKHAAQPDVSSSLKKANKEPLLSTASPSQENGPLIPQTCTTSLKDLDSKADHLLTRRVNHTQPISSHEDPTHTLLVDDHSTNPKSLNTTQKSSKEIVQIISERVTLSHQFGLKAKTLKQYIMSQYKIDLEQYSKQLGYTDMLSMLKQIPGIGFAHNSKTDLLIALGSHDKHHNSQPVLPKKNPFYWKKVADVLRLFPSGLRVEKLKQHVLNTHHIDLEVLSQERGYTDMLHMLKEVPDITSLNGDVFIASDIHKPKAQPVQVKKVKFSEKCMVNFLKSFPSGLKVERLSHHMKKKYNIDLIKYSQEKGSKDMVCWLQNIPGITVINKNLVIASDVYKKSNSKPNATCKTTPAKCPMNAGTGVTKKPHVGMKTAHGSQSVLIPSTTRPTRTGQNIPLPIGQIPVTNAMINSPQNVQPGLRPNVSYASACAGNLRKNQNNVDSKQCPPTFNVQKAHTAKAAHPTYKEAPKAVLASSKIKDNLQLLVKSHTNGLSIFRLKKLYLLQFQQPLVPKGVSLSARKLLMGFKDVAEIKGVGVQIKVFPVLSEDPSASTNTCRDSTPQEAAALEANDGNNYKVLGHLQVSSPLSIKNSTEHLKHSAPVPLSSSQPSSSGYNQTESTGGYIPISSSEHMNHKQPLYHNHSQPMTEICGKKLVTTTISHQANSSSVLASQFSEIYESPQTTGIAGTLSDTQWPLLPQKLSILKEIAQGAKRPQLENIPNKELSFKQNPTATSKPQEKDNSAQTSMQAHQNPYKTNGKTDYRQQEGQTSDLVHPTLKSDLSIVMDETSGFSVVTEKTNIDKDKKSMEIGRNAHVIPLQLNQSVYCNMAASTKGSAPEGSRKSVNVLMQQKADFNSKTVTQQTSNDLVTSRTMSPICPMPNKKSTDSQSQRNTTSVCNKNVDSKLKQLQATCESSQTGVTLLQSQGMQPSCSSGQMASMPSTGQLEASISQSIFDFGQRGFTPLPSKQEVAESNLTNRCGLAVSPKSKSPKKVPNSETVTKVETQHIPTKKSLSVTQTTSNGPPKSSPVSHSQQNVLVNPSVSSEGSSISHILHRDIDLNIANRQIDLKTQKQEHSQTRDGADGVKTPLPSAQQIASTGHVYTHGQTVTEPFQTQAKVPDPHTSSPVEQSRPLARIQHYYNGTAERPLGLGRSFTSKSYQHISDSLHNGIPSQSEFPMTPSDQEDNSDYGSEESTTTWQTDSGQICCIL